MVQRLMRSSNNFSTSENKPILPNSAYLQIKTLPLKDAGLRGMHEKSRLPFK